MVGCALEWGWLKHNLPIYLGPAICWGAPPYSQMWGVGGGRVRKSSLHREFETSLDCTRLCLNKMKQCTNQTNTLKTKHKTKIIVWCLKWLRLWDPYHRMPSFFQLLVLQSLTVDDIVCGRHGLQGDFSTSLIYIYWPNLCTAVILCPQFHEVSYAFSRQAFIWLNFSLPAVFTWTISPKPTKL